MNPFHKSFCIMTSDMKLSMGLDDTFDRMFACCKHWHILSLCKGVMASEFPRPLRNAKTVAPWEDQGQMADFS
jgi:hypothetical protein